VLPLTSIAGFDNADAARECGRVPVDRMALGMALCASASSDVQAQIANRCCSKMQQVGQNPSCLCAIVLSVHCEERQSQA